MPAVLGDFYREALNPSQLEAVNTTEGPLLVVAGAGSGKTRTLTYRAARLVDLGIAPNSILLLTFTRKSAAEMLRRAVRLLDARCEKIAGGTFHSFANMILRRYAGRIGFQPNFSIMDRADTESLISSLAKELKLAGQLRPFPKKHTLANIFSRAVNKVVAIEDVLYSDYPHFVGCLEAIGALAATYQRHKKDHLLLDYDDLLVYLKLLLAEHPDVCAALSSTYRYLMVDEYQDTNPIQAEIVRLLAGQDQNVMAVGDDSQSIYAFRGADFKNIMLFPQTFPRTRIIRLEENYRSVQPILSLANMIIDRARQKYTKVLFTRRSGGDLPLLVRADDENSQSLFVVSRIRELIRQDVALNQIAVLFRAGFHSFDLEIELGRAGIAFVKVGGFKFVESAHIKDVLAHLRVLVNPYDRVNWQRVLTLVDRVGPKTAQRIYSDLTASKSGWAGILKLKPPGAARIEFERLTDLFARLAAGDLTPAQSGAMVLEYYGPILARHYDDHPRRARDLEQLLAIIERYDRLDTFLADMALEPPNTSQDHSFTVDNAAEERLVLSTIHSAKGLEWHSVFIIWALDGRFPSLPTFYDEDALEEELRMMYVAATRARENLVITYPRGIYDRASGQVLSRPSRFIADMPTEVLPLRTVRRPELGWD